ncbi:hypothetical protein [Chryseobacterium taklimakanense]|uniref:hypothetical protein n=1 Tax=Chryseobacterium taklimakanense TaxID=536441 RepID=UPI0023F799E7|nr:hypothetical protein [Chryseobacterium taklimakanense]
MEKTTLLKLKTEIISCTETERLLELSINLRHFITIFNHKLAEPEISEETEKDIRNSVSLAGSYLKVIHWKLSSVKLDQENERIKILLQNKEGLFSFFEAGYEKFLNDHSATEKLKEQNAELKRLLNEQKLKSKSQKTIEERELKKLKEKSLALYNQILQLEENRK